MATFTYQAEDARGNTISGLIEASDEAGAKTALQGQGLHPRRVQRMATALNPAPETAIAPVDAADIAVPSGMAATLATTPPPTLPPLLQPVGVQSRIDAAPFLVSVPLSELAMMYRQLGTLIQAGVPMVQTLTTLAEQTRHGRLKSILREASSSVAGGNPLSKTMERYPSVFSALQIEMIRAAETSGMLEAMCNRIADYLERELEIRRKLKRETLYPKIVLFVAACVFLLLVFLKAGSEGALGYVKLGATILVVGIVVWWWARFLNQIPAVGAAWDHVKMLIPGPGGVTRRYATARFTRALAALYGSGVLLTNAVAISARACGNRAIGQRMLNNVPLLMSGQGIGAMLAASGLLSPIAVQMAKTGEQTGNLDLMMNKVADYLESEADAKAHQLSVFAGVAALLLAACVVGYLVISFYVGQVGQVMNAAGS
jgi:type IV pilus assembly protein PilC